jgi:transposase-like protein
MRLYFLMRYGSKSVTKLWFATRRFISLLRVMNELRSRGLNDILIAVVDGLKGFPDAITSVFPDTVVQTCIVHLIRNSLVLASWKDRKALAAALKPIYQAASVEAAEQALSDFEQSDWSQRFPTIGQSWRRHDRQGWRKLEQCRSNCRWEHIIPFFAFAAPVRKTIYTTNAIESLHSGVRKTIRNKGHFPNDEAATKLIWLALRNITAKWKNPPIASTHAKTQFAIQFGERFDLDD